MEWFGYSILVFVLLFCLFLVWWRERRYLKRKTSEVMSETLWREIERERAENLEKRRRFRETLREVQNRK